MAGPPEVLDSYDRAQRSGDLLALRDALAGERVAQVESEHGAAFAELFRTLVPLPFERGVVRRVGSWAVARLHLSYADAADPVRRALLHRTPVGWRIVRFSRRRTLLGTLLEGRAPAELRDLTPSLQLAGRLEPDDV